MNVCVNEWFCVCVLVCFYACVLQCSYYSIFCLCICILPMTVAYLVLISAKMVLPHRFFIIIFKKWMLFSINLIMCWMCEQLLNNRKCFTLVLQFTKHTFNMSHTMKFLKIIWNKTKTNEEYNLIWWAVIKFAMLTKIK